MKLIRKHIIAGLPYFILFLPSLAMAGVNAGLSISEEYDDNVFLTHQNKETDTVTVIEPHLEYLWSDKGHNLRFAYHSNMRIFYENTDENHQQHVAIADAKLLLPLKNYLTLWVRDEYTFFQRDIRKAEAAGNQAEGNDLGIRPVFRFGLLEPLYLEAGLMYQRRDYIESEDGVEWEGEGANFGGGLKLIPQLEVGVIYRHFYKEFSPNFFFPDGFEDYTDDTLGGKLKCDFSDKLAGEASYSRLWREYESEREFEGHVWDGILTFKILDETTLDINYSQRLLEQVDGTPYEREAGEAMLTHIIRESGKLRYGAFAYRDTYLNTDRIDEAWGGQAVLDFPFFTRFLFSVEGRYERRTYIHGFNTQLVLEDDKENADYYNIEAELGYNIADWLRIFVHYTRIEKCIDDSISGISDYANNRYAVGMEFIYE